MKYKSAFFTLLLITFSCIYGLTYILTRKPKYENPVDATYYIQTNSQSPTTHDSASKVVVYKSDTAYIIRGPVSISIK